MNYIRFAQHNMTLAFLERTNHLVTQKYAIYKQDFQDKGFRNLCTESTVYRIPTTGFWTCFEILIFN